MTVREEKEEEDWASSKTSGAATLHLRSMTTFNTPFLFSFSPFKNISLSHHLQQPRTV